MGAHSGRLALKTRPSAPAQTEASCTGSRLLSPHLPDTAVSPCPPAHEEDGGVSQPISVCTRIRAHFPCLRLTGGTLICDLLASGPGQPAFRLRGCSGPAHIYLDHQGPPDPWYVFFLSVIWFLTWPNLAHGLGIQFPPEFRTPFPTPEPF